MQSAFPRDIAVGIVQTHNSRNWSRSVLWAGLDALRAGLGLGGAAVKRKGKKGSCRILTH